MKTADVIIPIASGLIISIAGYMATRKKSIKVWMNERKIEYTNEDNGWIFDILHAPWWLKILIILAGNSILRLIVPYLILKDETYVEILKRVADVFTISSIIHWILQISKNK
jgi:hypothetical protein